MSSDGSGTSLPQLSSLGQNSHVNQATLSISPPLGATPPPSLKGRGFRHQATPTRHLQDWHPDLVKRLEQLQEPLSVIMLLVKGYPN